MVVSQYWVLGIQVSGLVLGLMGAFYLSVGLFGKMGSDIFTPLLPATAAALGGGIGFWFLWFASLPAPQRVPLFLEANTALAVLFAMVLFIVEYALVLVMRYYLRRQRDYPNLTDALPLRIIVIAVPVYFLFFALSNLHTYPSIVNAVTHAGLEVTSAVALCIPPAAIPLLSERRLQVIGFGTIVVALLTQFIPPVLDLLNIPIR